MRIRLVPALAAFIAAGAILLGAGCANTEPKPSDPALASRVDLSRMMGRWYVVAHIPYLLEKGFVGSINDFSLRPDGTITDVFWGKRHDFQAEWKKVAAHDRVVPGTDNARWDVQFFWPVHFPLLILYVAPDYRTALIGYPDRSKGWIYSRTPEIDDATYRSLLGRLRDKGYDTSKFLKIPQKPEQLGRPGFDTPG